MKLASLLVLVALAVGAPVAQALDISPAGKQALGAQAGIGPQGATTVAWSVEGTYQMAARPLGSLAFGAPVDVMPAPANATGATFAFGSGGDAAATFEVGTSIQHAVKAAVRRAGDATFAAPLPVSVSTNDQTLPQAVVGPDGRVTVVWQEKDGSNPKVRSAVLAPGAAVFDAAVDVSPPAIADDLNPRAAIDASGAVTVVWERFNGQRTVVEGARRAAGASAFTPSVKLSAAAGSAKHPVVAVTPQGDATVAWIAFDGDGTSVQAATWPAGASAPVDRQTLSDPADQVGDAAVAVSAKGDATVVWARAVLETSGPSIGLFREDNIQAASRAADDVAFGPALPVSPSGTGAQLPQVVVGSGGTVTVAWRGAVDANYIAQVASRGAREPGFSTPQPLSAVGSNASGPALAIDPVEDVTVAWVRAGLVQAEVLDTGGPALDGLTVPETAQAGVPFSVSVSPRDDRSGLGATTWRFGDGASAAGTTAAHTYAAPGTYLVTVTAADGHGITTSAKRRVIVTAATANDTTAPTIRRASLSRKRLRPAARGDVLVRKPARTGATLRLVTSEAGRLALTIERKQRGRRVGSRCSSTAHRGTRCTRLVRAARVTTTVAAGKVTRHLSARSAKGRLARGRYRLTLVLTDVAGNASAPTRLTFTVGP